MKEKIIFLLVLLIFSSLGFLTLPSFAQSYEYTESETITCGNGICEVMEFQLKKGEDTPVEIAGKTYNFKFLEIIQTKSDGKIVSYRTVIFVNGEEVGGEMGVEEIKEKYGFHFIATAKSENIASVKIQETEVNDCMTDCTFNVELNLYKKWNLVPVYLLDETTFPKGTCKLQDFRVIYGYDSIKKEYVKLHSYGKTVSDLSNSLRYEFGKIGESENIFVGTGFNSVWIYSINECKLAAELPNTLKNMLLQFQKSKERGMKFYFAPGWNFWSGSKDMQGKNLNEIKGDCIIEKAYTFEAQSQSWKKLEASPGAETNFIFKVKDKCMFGFEETGLPILPE